MKSRYIEKLIITNEAGDSIEFSVRSVFHCNVGKDVKGLSDAENDIFSASGIGQSGATYLGYHVLSRNISIVGHLKTLDKTAAREYRRQLNHLFMPDSELTVIYEHGDFRRKIFARVQSAPQYDPKVFFTEFTLELVCLDPFWTDENESYEQIATWTGSMIFDSAKGLEVGNSAEDKNWEVGYRSPSLIVHIENEGDAKAGMTVSFRAQGAVVNPGIMNLNTREFIKFIIALAYGEELIIKTSYGEKSAVYIAANGAVSDAFQYLDINSSFLQLAVGDNPIRYFAQSGESDMNVTINYRNMYLGV